MTKSERLLKILELLAHSDEVAVEAIAEKFNVSKRTIFRDLRTLMKAGYYAEPITIAQNRITPPKFTQLEMRMIKFALTTHHLAQVFPFSELSKRLNAIES